MRPLTATAAAVTSERQAEQDRPLPADVDAQVRRGVLAQQQPVEGARTEHDQRGPDDDQGSCAASRSHDDPSNAPSRYAKIWRRAAPDRYIAIASPAASSEPTA